jgi:hypothetical protein
MLRADCRGAIDMDELLSTGYAFQVETTQLAHLAGAHRGGAVRLLRTGRRRVEADAADLAGGIA